MFEQLLNKLICRLINKGVEKSAENQKKTDYELYSREIKMPKAYLILGICYIMFFVGISVFCYIVDDETTIWIALGLFAFSFLGIPIVLICLNWHLEYDDEKVIVRNSLRITKEYYIKDIKGFVDGIDCVKVITEKGNFSIDNKAIGLDEFIRFVKSKR